MGTNSDDPMEGYFKCVRGPWDGQTLFLSHGTTGIFEYKGPRGRYVQRNESRKLYWEPHDERT